MKLMYKDPEEYDYEPNEEDSVDTEEWEYDFPGSDAWDDEPDDSYFL